MERRLLRERLAREEAEAIAERVTREQYALLIDLTASRAVLDETPDFVAVMDADGAASYVNRALRELIDVDGSGAGSVTIDRLLTPLSYARYLSEALPALHDKGVWRGEFAMVRPRGGEMPVSQVLIGHHDATGDIQRISFIARDVTEQRDLTDLLEHRSLHDALTGLPNRRLLFDRLDMAVARTTRTGQPMAVLFMDLDGFKSVNDLHGHATGDAVLLAVVQRMQDRMRDADTLARVGGDEFVLLCESVGGEADAQDIAARLIEAVRQPVTVGDRQLTVGLSVGAAFSALPGATPDVLVREADAAMYAAKSAGKGTVRLVTVQEPAPEAL